MKKITIAVFAIVVLMSAFAALAQDTASQYTSELIARKTGFDTCEVTGLVKDATGAAVMTPKLVGPMNAAMKIESTDAAKTTKFELEVFCNKKNTTATFRVFTNGTLSVTQKFDLQLTK